MSAADPMIGRLLRDRYSIVELIGRGASGRVYRAAQRMGATTRDVAIKVLRTEGDPDPSAVARFRRECEIVIELSHPNTIQFFDFGELDDGTMFIVMEHLQGETLAAAMARGAMSVDRFDRLLRQICGSLGEAHERGIVHRDLKPQNIFLTNRGGHDDFAKVLDFGIAKRSTPLESGGTQLTQDGVSIGTPRYMSPEQFSGGTLDARTDVYALGVISYEALTGRAPFRANTPWEWATMHLTQPPDPIESTERGASLPAFKREAIRIALEKEPTRRFGSMSAFLAAMTGSVSAIAHAATAVGVAPRALPASVPSPLGGFSARVAIADATTTVHGKSRLVPIAITLAALGLCALIGAGIGLAMSMKNERPGEIAHPTPPLPSTPRRTTEARGPVMTAPPVQPVAGDAGHGNVQPAAADPRERRIARAEQLGAARQTSQAEPPPATSPSAGRVETSNAPRAVRSETCERAVRCCHATRWTPDHRRACREAERQFDEGIAAYGASAMEGPCANMIAVFRDRAEELSPAALAVCH